MDWYVVGPNVAALIVLLWAGYDRLTRAREVAAEAQARANEGRGKYIQGLAAATLDIVTASQEELRDLRSRVRHLEQTLTIYGCAKPQCDMRIPVYIPKAPALDDN